MTSNKATLGEILNSPNQYLIPVFQRYYRWDQPEWAKLWDSLEGLQRPEKTGKHFLGFLVLVSELPLPGKLTTYYLIDGQQRLTTLSLLLVALRDVARESGMGGLADEVAETSLIHRHRTGTERFRLYPKQGDREPYLAAVQGEPVPEGRIASALSYFRGKLTTLPEYGTEGGLRAFYSLLIQRLEFINARLDGENPFHIFKSLNSTGVPLGPADLIRNFLFMQVPVEAQDAFNEELWKPIETRFRDPAGQLDAARLSAFLRDVLMREGAYVSPDRTFEAFQDRHESTDFDARQVAADLKRAAASYSIIIGDEADSDAGVQAALAMLRELDSATTRSLLLNLYRRRQAGQIDADALAGSIRQLAGFILRRFICGESSRNYSRMFVQANAEIGDDPAGDLIKYLVARGFPHEGRFIVDFARANLYKSRYCKAVLEAIERSHEHHEAADTTQAQIEHVLPQTLTDAWRDALGPDADAIHHDWAHTPGNLTLTGYNPELSNKSFPEKRAIYKDSHYVITKSISHLAGWDADQIRNRGQEMASRAAGIWPGPVAPSGPTMATPNNAQNKQNALRRKFWAGLRDHVAASGSTLKLQQPTDYYSIRCGVLGGGVNLRATIQAKRGEVAICASFGGPKAAQRFREALAHREAIEEAVGAKLQWTSSRAGDSFYALHRNPADLAQEPLWPSYFDWMTRTLEAFRHAFGVHLPPPPPPPATTGDALVLSVTQQLQLDYWTALNRAILQGGAAIKPRKPPAQAWHSFSIGRSGYELVATVNKGQRRIDVALVINGALAKPRFHALEAGRQAIEAEFGEPLTWREMPEAIQSQVRLTRTDADIADQAAWPVQHAWIVEKLLTFRKVFAARIKALADATEDAGNPVA